MQINSAEPAKDDICHAFLLTVQAGRGATLTLSCASQFRTFAQFRRGELWITSNWNDAGPGFI